MSAGFLAACTLFLLSFDLAQAAPRRLLGTSFGATTLNLFNSTTTAIFDYVVVGGGNTGMPIAVRLAEAGYKVALVEAGTFASTSNANFSEVPLFASAFSFPGAFGNGALLAPMIDWNFSTVPQTQIGQTQSRLLSTGKALGGGTVRSHNLFHFANKGFYDRWAALVHDDAYSWSRFKDFLDKPLNITPPASTRFSNSTPRYDFRLASSTAGPLSVTFGAYAWAWSSWARDALSHAGIKERPDGFTAGSLIGGGWIPFTFESSTFTRDSAETSYLAVLGIDNGNLVTYQNTLATKINFDEAKNAISVDVDFAGVPLTLRAKREIILSAGALRSPQILMVSGIGPSKTLQQYNIPIVVDLPGVGRNLQDHVLVGSISRRVELETTARLADPAYMNSQTETYLSSPPTGPLTTFGSDYLAFEKLPERYRHRLAQQTQEALARDYGADWPELEYLISSEYIGPSPNNFIGSPDGRDWAAMVVAQAVQFSRGNVSLLSPDVRDPPVIDPGWLSDPRDMDIAIQAYLRLQELMNQTTLEPIWASPEQFPPATATVTRKQITDIIKVGALSEYQFVGTCAMAMPEDARGVVDSVARVRGVQKLRIADASIIPLSPPGHLSGTLYGLAEKIAVDVLSAR